MAFNRACDDYEKSIEEEVPFAALLGGFVNGAFQFVVATNPALAYVRYPNGFQTTAKHRSKIDLSLDPANPDNQNIAIALFYDRYKKLAIYELDPNEGGAILQRDPNAGAGAVKLVVAGTGISVDNTNPVRPVVSTTGSGGNSALYTETGDVTLSNSTTETSIYVSGVGSLALAANWWATNGRVLSGKNGGEIGTKASSPGNFTWRVGFVGTPLITLVYAPPGGLAGYWETEWELNCFSPGVSGSFLGPLRLTIYDSTSAVIVSMVAFASGTADTTGILTIDETFQMATADAANYLSARYFVSTVRYHDPN